MTASDGPLWVDMKTARRICGSFGEKKFRALVNAGVFPYRCLDPDNPKRRFFSRLALEEHARSNGGAS